MDISAFWKGKYLWEVFFSPDNFENPPCLSSHIKAYFPVIYYHKTNHLKTEWLKTTTSICSQFCGSRSWEGRSGAFMSYPGGVSWGSWAWRIDLIFTEKGGELLVEEKRVTSEGQRREGEKERAVSRWFEEIWRVRGREERNTGDRYILERNKGDFKHIFKLKPPLAFLREVNKYFVFQLLFRIGLGETLNWDRLQSGPALPGSQSTF